jgi:hypothetical protein
MCLPANVVMCTLFTPSNARLCYTEVIVPAHTLHQSRHLYNKPAQMTVRACHVVHFLVTLSHLCRSDDSEFRKGVSELVKAKLEKPKRLGQLAQRWWNEVFYGSLIFDRQVGKRGAAG